MLPAYGVENFKQSSRSWLFIKTLLVGTHHAEGCILFTMQSKWGSQTIGHGVLPHAHGKCRTISLSRQQQRYTAVP